MIYSCHGFDVFIYILLQVADGEPKRQRNIGMQLDKWPVQKNGHLIGCYNERERVREREGRKEGQMDIGQKIKTPPSAQITP